MTNTVASDALAREALVRSAARGDEAAFARLVAEHHASMARVAFVICGDPEATRDAVQTAWTIAWRRMGTLREPSRVRAWLVAIAANEARKLAALTRRSRIRDISRAMEHVHGSDAVESLEMIDLEMVLAGLSPEDRQLLALRYSAGLDSAEIGRELRMSASGVRSRLARLLERLRADLAIPEEVAR